MNLFHGRVERIAEEIGALEEVLVKHEDDIFVPVIDVAKWLRAIRQDLDSALLDEAPYSERTRAGFPSEPGVSRVNERAVTVEWHGERAYTWRFAVPRPIEGT